MSEEKKNKKEVKKKKSKASKTVKKFTLTELFKKHDIAEDIIHEILLMNGITNIDDVDIKLSDAEFNEIINIYNTKRL